MAIIDMDLHPLLDNHDFLLFIVDANEAAIYEEPLSVPAGFSEEARRVAGHAPDNPALLATRCESYNVIEGNGVLVSSFDVDIPTTQVVSISTVRHLLVADGASAESKLRIVQSFNAYDAAIHGDLAAYTEAQLAQHGVASDSLRVVSTFRLEKVGPPVPREEQKLAMLSLYRGHYPGGTRLDIDGDTAVTDFLRRFHLVLVRETVKKEPSPKFLGNPQVVEGNPPRQIEIDQIIRNDWNSTGNDCAAQAMVTERERIATIFRFPEIKIDWEVVRIDIGCGASIYISVPRIRTRESEIVLYAYVARAANVGNIMVTHVKNCMIKAAVTGAVVGIVMANFPGALAAFKAVFVECIKYHVGNYVRCLAPNLVITVEPGNWTA